MELANAIRENINLKKMRLSLTNIGDKGVFALLDAIKTNHSFVWIALKQLSKITSEGKRRIYEA